MLSRRKICTAIPCLCVRTSGIPRRATRAPHNAQMVAGSNVSGKIFRTMTRWRCCLSSGQASQPVRDAHAQRPVSTRLNECGTISRACRAPNVQVLFPLPTSVQAMRGARSVLPACTSHRVRTADPSCDAYDEARACITLVHERHRLPVDVSLCVQNEDIPPLAPKTILMIIGTLELDG